MVTILRKNIDEKSYLSNLASEESKNRKSILDNLETFLNDNWYISEIVQAIYDIDSSIIKTENDKNTRILLLNFLSTIFLYKEELESRKELEIQKNEISENRKLLKKQFDDFSYEVKEKIDLMLKDTLDLKLKYEEEVRRNSSLSSQLEYKEETLEIALETVYDLNQKVLELTEKNKWLISRIKKIKVYLNKIVDKKVKERNKEYLIILEEELRKKLEQELELKKILLETEIEKINNTFNISLSSKDLEIAELNQLLDLYKTKISELEARLLKKTNENVDLILDKTRQFFEEDTEKKDESNELQKLKKMLEEQKLENQRLEARNQELEFENSILSDENQKLKETIVKVS